MTQAHSDKPFFMSINFMKVHQPNMPAPEFHRQIDGEDRSSPIRWSRTTRASATIMDKMRALGLDKNTYVFWTTDNGAWQDVYPDAGYTPFRGTKGTDREGGDRVPALAWGPGIKPAARIPTSSAASTTWRPSPRSRGVKLPRRIAKASR